MEKTMEETTKKKSERIPANELSAGVALYTKNGASNGNAIAVEFDEGKNAWLIQSEYGMKFHLTAEEVKTKFTLGHQTTVKEWAGCQLAAILRNSSWPHLAKSINRDMAEKALAKYAEDAIQVMAAIKAEKERKVAMANPPKQKKSGGSKRNGKALGRSFATIRANGGKADNIFERVFGN